MEYQTVQDPGDNSLEETQDIINTLSSYWHEADNARRGGDNPRDEKWTENLDLYWNRFNFSQKADWQAKEVLPEVPGFVDRFAAALKEALLAAPDNFYTVQDPADKEGDLGDAIKRMMNMWLSTSGRASNGNYLPFSAVFEEQVKLGSLMAMASTVTWKNDTPGGRIAIEAVDPRFVWLDHTYRNLYRIRRMEVDLRDLKGMVNMKDNRGDPIWNLDGIQQLVNSFSPEDQQTKGELTGTGQMISSSRSPIVLDEFLADIVDSNGEVKHKNALCVVANQRFLVRGPEKNPFWHGKDWLVFAPLVTVPLSPYGRTYMEDFASVAKTFNELTNLILDAVHTVALRAYAIVPGALLNPEQAVTGIWPNKTFLLEDGYSARDFAQGLELGTLPPEVMQIWTAMKNELREAAKQNEIGIGQLAPKSRTTAFEIASTQQSSGSVVRGFAETIETRWLDPTLDLVWKTGLQHADGADQRLAAAAGAEMYQAIYSRRREFITRPMTFQARGISTMIQKTQRLQTVIQLMQVIAGNDALLKSFMAKINIDKFITRLFQWADIDLTQFQLSEREQMMQQAMAPLQQLQERMSQTPLPQSPGATEMADLVNAMGAGGGQEQSGAEGGGY